MNITALNINAPSPQCALVQFYGPMMIGGEGSAENARLENAALSAAAALFVTLCSLSDSAKLVNETRT